MTRDHFSAVSNWYPCRILVAHAFRAVNSGTKACEARYWSCDRLRSAMVTIEGSLIFFDRSKGDSRQQRERRLTILRTRKGFDV
jgi:hypothetical protein